MCIRDSLCPVLCATDRANDFFVKDNLTEFVQIIIVQSLGKPFMQGITFGPVSYTHLLSVVDRAILTPAHMYKDNGIDPEGLLSTIPALSLIHI